MDTKFRAVLTIFGNFKVMEMRFDGLNEDNTKVSINVNDDNRHGINEDSFMKAILNLTDALNHYTDSIMCKMIIGKMLGMV